MNLILKILLHKEVTEFSEPSLLPLVATDGERDADWKMVLQKSLEKR
jgi:hypothetical protein